MTAVRRLCQILALLTNVKRSPRYNNNTFGQMQLYTNREENTKIEIPIHTCLLCLYLAFCVIIEILWQPFLHWHCMTLTVTDRYIVVCITGACAMFSNVNGLLWCMSAPANKQCCSGCSCSSMERKSCHHHTEPLNGLYISHRQNFIAFSWFYVAHEIQNRLVCNSYTSHWNVQDLWHT